MADYSKIVLNIENVPDYLSVDRLREIINIGIHDVIRHVDNINTDSSVIFEITVHEAINGNRKITIETFLESGLHGEINKPLVLRTIIQPTRQNDLICANLNIQG